MRLSEMKDYSSLFRTPDSPPQSQTVIVNKLIWFTDQIPTTLLTLSTTYRPRGKSDTWSVLWSVKSDVWLVNQINLFTITQSKACIVTVPEAAQTSPVSFSQTFLQIGQSASTKTAWRGSHVTSTVSSGWERISPWGEPRNARVRTCDEVGQQNCKCIFTYLNKSSGKIGVSPEKFSSSASATEEEIEYVIVLWWYIPPLWYQTTGIEKKSCFTVQMVIHINQLRSTWFEQNKCQVWDGSHLEEAWVDEVWCSFLRWVQQKRILIATEAANAWPQPQRESFSVETEETWEQRKRNKGGLLFRTNCPFPPQARMQTPEAFQEAA